MRQAQPGDVLFRFLQVVPRVKDKQQIEYYGQSETEKVPDDFI